MNGLRQTVGRHGLMNDAVICGRVSCFSKMVRRCPTLDMLGVSNVEGRARAYSVAQTKHGPTEQRADTLTTAETSN